jgi:tetratricopeptide (TPR) repeat protein
MGLESKENDELTENSVSLSEHDYVDEINAKLIKARRLFSLHDYASCEELARQVLEVDPENSTAKALFQLTGINRSSRKRLQKIVDPQLPKEDQAHPDKVGAERKRFSVELDNVALEPPRGKLSERIVDPQLPEERQSELEAAANVEQPSSVESDNFPSEHQSTILESSKPGEGNNPRGAFRDESLPEDTLYPHSTASTIPDNAGSADNLREKTIAALVEFFNEKNKSLHELVPKEPGAESEGTESKGVDRPDVPPLQEIEPPLTISDKAWVKGEEAKNSAEVWGEMSPLRTPESRAEDYMASAVSYYHERRLPEALATAREALRLRPGHQDASEFVGFVQKRLKEGKRRKRWAVAMLMIWLLIGLIILAYRGRNRTGEEGHKPLNSEQPGPPNTQPFGQNDTQVQTASPPPAQDKSAVPPQEGSPTTPQIESSVTELSPEEVVKTFYTRAAADDFVGAWDLAGPGFRQQLKGFERFKNAQRSLQSIEFLRAERTSQTASRATVAIETIAVHTNRTDHCKGSLSLVRKGANGSWVLNWANGIHCESQPRGTLSGSGK